MSDDVFTETLNRFCGQMSEKIVYLAEQDDDAGIRTITAGLLDAIREAQANLELCAYECERMLARG